MPIATAIIAAARIPASEERCGAKSMANVKAVSTPAIMAPVS